MSTTETTFTARTAAVLRVQGAILPKAVKDLIQDMAATLDMHHEMHKVQNEINDLNDEMLEKHSAKHAIQTEWNILCSKEVQKLRPQ